MANVEYIGAYLRFSDKRSVDNWNLSSFGRQINDDRESVLKVKGYRYRSRPRDSETNEQSPCIRRGRMGREGKERGAFDDRPRNDSPHASFLVFPFRGAV